MKGAEQRRPVKPGPGVQEKAYKSFLPGYGAYISALQTEKEMNEKRRLKDREKCVLPGEISSIF